jgi:hypothetical protein
MEVIAPMMVLIVAALTIGSIWRSAIVNRRLRENSRVWGDLQGKLIDRFGDASEVVRYLESDAGRKLLEGQTTSAASPHARVLDAVHLGMLVLTGGAGMLAAGTVTDPSVSEFLHVLGLVAVVLGVGYLASAAVSWAMLRSWGLLDRPTREEA